MSWRAILTAPLVAVVVVVGVAFVIIFGMFGIRIFDMPRIFEDSD